MPRSCNLIVNAAEALSTHQGTDRTIRLVARGADRKVLISVSDHGPGIPARIRTQLFQPFATHGKSNGTGLGLAIAKQIVDAHGGDLSFTTGTGMTTFLVEIPRSEIADASLGIREMADVALAP